MGDRAPAAPFDDEKDDPAPAAEEDQKEQKGYHDADME